MSLRVVASLLPCLVLGLAGPAGAEDLNEIERGLKAYYEGKVVVVRTPDQKKIRLDLPKEERDRFGKQREFLLRVEGITLR
ncbi:MAG: hypothetical protein ACRD4D_01970, partial [Candidatus Acidiferrales bacterium]